MTTFTRTWNASYEALPGDADDALEGAGRIRHVRVDVRERLEVDHSWAGDVDDGLHKKVTFVDPLGAKPTQANDETYLYTKDVSGTSELFFEDESGNEVQLSAGGERAELVGKIVAYPAAVPTGWLECNGQAVSRTTYSSLFALIGTTFGVGDGSTTFNLPDITGRVIAGLESTATRLTSGVSGVDGGTLGASGGDQNMFQHLHSVNINSGTESADHTHSMGIAQIDPGHAGGAGLPPWGTGAGSNNTGGRSATHYHNVNGNTANAGSGTAENVQPTIVLRWIIKY